LKLFGLLSISKINSIMSKIDSKPDEELNQCPSSNSAGQNKITFDQIASVLLKQNFILTALEFHTELAESGRELPRLRDYFSNPANFEQSQNQAATTGSISSSGFFPLHKASSIQTFDSLDLTRYSDDNDQNKYSDDKIAVLEFELRKAKETISQLRATLTIATENQGSSFTSKSFLNANSAEKNEKICTQIEEPFTRNKSLNKEIIFDIEVENNDKIEEKELKNSVNDLNKPDLSKPLMPHDKNAINFLVNEYLLENDYKMTSVTFAEENESQDLEDWDVVGLNRAKPPNLCQLYRFYINKSKLKKNSEPKMTKNDQTENFSQTEYVLIEAKSTNTDFQMEDFGCQCNFDKETFDTQKIQIKTLLEKQELLLKSISKFESDIIYLNTEREAHLRKIDMLTVNLEKSKKMIENSAENGSHEENTISLESNLSELSERKIPVVFKEILNKYSSLPINESNQCIVDELSNLRPDANFLLSLLFDSLPKIVQMVSNENRLSLLPLILASSIVKQEQISRLNIKKDQNLIELLFNLIERPDIQQRAMILNTCIQYTKYTGPIYVNNFLLPQFWEQLSEKMEEKRIMVAEACAILAPYIYNDIRSSLMFSILKQLIEHEGVESVRVSAIKSLGILINYISDEQKFQQCIEILDMCVTDSSDLVFDQVEEIFMPSMSLWSISINKFSNVLITHLIEKVEFYLQNSKNLCRKNEDNKNYEKYALNYMKLLNLNIQFIFAFVLIHFRNSEQVEDAEFLNKKLPILNSYFHSLKEKLDIKLNQYEIDSILEDYLSLTTRYLTLIESDSWSSIELSDAFEWITDSFVRKLIQISAQVDAKDELCPYLAKIFRNFTLLFSIDFELIKSKVSPIFEKLLNIPDSELDLSNSSVFDQTSSSKLSLLYKSTLPVYFVGILSTIVDIELYGWFDLSSNMFNDQEDMKTLKSETSPSGKSHEKVICSSDSKPNFKKSDPAIEDQTPLQKRIDNMNIYLKNVFFALSLNQGNLDAVISIYELMKLKSKSADYVIQMLLSTLWDGIVHISLYVRCNTAKLFEILVTDCNEYLLSTRILPALITLANDSDKMVRCSSISPLTSIIENCENKEILERVYTQLQFFLSDPILKDEFVLQIELLKTFRRISTKLFSHI
ncbi:lisH domain and HEAT repeat-containing KIAA1468-like protein, partial [Brachionus plicatilis]